MVSTISRHANVAGVSLFYLEAGPEDAPTVVLLHGYPSSSRMYAPLTTPLADRYHLIAPDYPGFGQSEAPPPSRYHYTFDHLAETMGALLEQLSVDRYVLFMQDYGGPIGMRLALAHPQRVHALIVQNANAYQEGLGPKWAGIARYWADPAAHPEQVDAFMSLEAARQRHLGNSPHPERYNPDTWTDELSRWTNRRTRWGSSPGTSSRASSGRLTDRFWAEARSRPDPSKRRCILG